MNRNGRYIVHIYSLTVNTPIPSFEADTDIEVYERTLNYQGANYRITVFDRHTLASVA